MGSGKTTLIRNWMRSQAHPWVAVNLGGRRLPLGYTLDRPGQQVFLAGAYEEGLQTSGCDTIKDTAFAYGVLAEHFHRGEAVVYEGLFMMNHTRGLRLLRDTRAVTVLRLTTSLDVCLQGVVDRRAAQGNTGPLPPRFAHGLGGNAVRALNYAYKMGQAGATVLRVSREEAAVRLAEMTS